MAISIEKAVPSDAALILEYLKQVGGETDNSTYDTEGLPFSVESEAEFISGMENSYDDIMLVVKDGSKIIGNASLNRLPRRMKHRGDFAVSVAKEYWNKGIGSKLLHEVINFAKENSFEIIDLQVRSDNLPAIHLYEKIGFKKIGTHPGFFKIDAEEIPFDFMSLKL